MRSAAFFVIALMVVGILACNGAEQTTREAEPTPTTEYLWTLLASTGTRGLFTKDCLEDDTSPLCDTIADLSAGTLLRPGPGGCETAIWASDWEDSDQYHYCHVQVASGDHEGEWGWVNENAIEK